jgi:hypothetical protein
MASSIGVVEAVARPVGAKSRPESLTAALARKVVSFVRGNRENEIEKFIQERGGVMSDALEREIGDRFGPM